MTSRVLFASQLGAGTGHLHVAAAVREAVAGLGGHCDVAVRDPAAAQRMATLAGTAILPAPDHRMAPRKLPPAACWAEALLAAGHEAPDVVAGLVSGWLGLLDALEPDRLVTEYCPAAILAGRIRGVPTRSIGSGFTVPPALAPMPTLQPWRTLPPDRFEAAEGRILAAFRTALERFGSPPIAELAELYPVASTRLLNFPEFDHYGLRGPEHCFGPIGTVDRGPAVAGGAQDAPILVAYYHSDYARFPEVLAWLRRTKLPTLLVAPGMTDRARRAHSSDRLAIETRQIDLEAALAGARLAVTHGGEGSAAAVLRCGTPLAVIPQYLEQGLLAHRLQAQHLAISVQDGPDGALPDVQALMEHLRQPAFRAAREGFAARHGHHDPAEARAALGRWLVA